MTKDSKTTKFKFKIVFLFAFPLTKDYGVTITHVELFESSLVMYGFRLNSGSLKTLQHQRFEFHLRQTCDTTCIDIYKINLIKFKQVLYTHT